MPRKHIPENPDYPYHICSRTVNRVPYKLPLDEMWEIFSDFLYLVTRGFGLRIYAFVLMQNHFHLLVRAPQTNLGVAMNHFMRESSKEINRLSGSINQNFGTRFHRTLVDNPNYAVCVYKYVLRNPVRAGLCRNVEYYRYSTISGLLGKVPLYFPVENEMDLNLDQSLDTLSWLNTDPKKGEEDEIRRALRQGIMNLRRDPVTGKLQELGIPPTRNNASPIMRVAGTLQVPFLGAGGGGVADGLR